MRMAIEVEAAFGPNRQVLLVLALIAFAAAVFSRPPIAQDAAYHAMADTRRVFGIANGLNVVSNVPFALVGVAGLIGVFPRGAGRDPHEARVRGPYVAVFVGTALTALGSAYYHLAPDNARLVWDRLPMAVVCAGLVTVVVAESVSGGAARRMFLPLLACAVMSVAYWRWSELRGAGDLRPYVMIQYGSLFAIGLVLVLGRNTFRGAWHLTAALIAYGVAKGFETADASIFAVTRQAVSGHTLKHLMAAVGLACIAAMVHGGSARTAAEQPRP
jgi:hypothetical protein